MTPHRFLDAIAAHAAVVPYGEVRRVAPGRIEASGPAATVGDLCAIGEAMLLAEVAAAGEDGLILVPVAEAGDIGVGARVERWRAAESVGVGDSYAGRAIDALGRPIDGGGPIAATRFQRPRGDLPPTLDRVAPHRVLETGIRAIDGLLTLGIGQRIGIFAASGVGKTSLVEQLVAQSDATRCILCLVGERGREVEQFWASVASRRDRDRFTIVAATSDESAVLRARSVSVALCLADHWRGQGEHVLLVIDSVTRLAMALREIGLAAGEPPTARAYTPNVFAALPRMVERCGAVRGQGAITAVMTVLSETDEVDDPIVETMKSLLDGHIVLSRTLAEQGHFPAIDLPRSVSRLAGGLMAPDQAHAARAAVAQLSLFDEARVMIQSGIYQRGSDAATDAVIAGREALLAFLRQPNDRAVPIAETKRALLAMMRGAAHG
ncbi:FliI/YscN family ATPase [Sphingomonas sp. Leaf4]|uniref:FliI/YscN family ATPase n=1 Tax=Sphingomonas sp. Leaf4 TaxID=2876553 RepID=UPI001E36B0BC|nr:FliI/YscN family ATPase [Sphingomonas sp. Leaf4]